MVADGDTVVVIVSIEPESPDGHSNDNVENNATHWYPVTLFKAFPHVFFLLILTRGLVLFFFF